MLSTTPTVDTVAARDARMVLRAPLPGWLQDERFRLQSQRTYDRQYAQLYFARLMSLQPAMKERIAQEWPGVPRGYTSAMEPQTKAQPMQHCPTIAANNACGDALASSRKQSVARRG